MKSTLIISSFLMLIVTSCSTVEQSGQNVVSHDAERHERLDSLSSVKSDSVVIQKTFIQSGNQPAKTKEKK